MLRPCAGAQANDEAKLACLHKVTEEVAAELKQMHDYNAAHMPASDTG